MIIDDYWDQKALHMAYIMVITDNDEWKREDYFFFDYENSLKHTKTSFSLNLICDLEIFQEYVILRL